MHTVTFEMGNTTHVFTSENEFVSQGDWILENKGQEVHDAWALRNETEEGMTHPDTIALYEEWLDVQGITHTQTPKD